MEERHGIVVTPSISGPIQVGVPAEEPTEVLAALVSHFKSRPHVRSAALGLVRFLDAPPPLAFSYTIGITCSTDKQREEEDDLAAQVLRSAGIATSRWPICFLPPRTRYFHPDARRFYPVPEVPPKRGLIARIFR
jgi:SseB protein C-terminal domain